MIEVRRCVLLVVEVLTIMGWLYKLRRGSALITTALRRYSCPETLVMEVNIELRLISYGRIALW